MSRPFQDSAKVSTQRDLQVAPLFAGRQHDALDQPPDGGCRGVAFFGIAQGGSETRHLALVDAGNVRMNVRDLGGNRCQALLEFFLPGFHFAQPVDHAFHVAAVFDGGDHCRHLPFDFGKLLAVRFSGGIALPVETVDLVRPCAHGVSRLLGCHQTVLEAGENAFLKNGAANAAPIRAASVHHMVGTAVAVLPAHRIGPAAGAAFDKAGEEVAGPVGSIEAIGARRARGLDDGGVFLGKLFLPVLHCLPEFVVDDAELRHLRDYPILPGVDSRDPLAGLRVLDVSEPVPDQAPDVELVVDEPGAALDLAPDGGIGPEPARGAGNVLGVEASCDRPGADA